MEPKAPPTAKMTHRFAFKVMACAFCGIHIPLIGMLVYFFSLSGTPSTLRVLFSILIFTLVGAGATLLILNRMMRPLQSGNKAIQEYITSRKLPNMPKHSNDELGILFQQVEYLMFILQKTVSERNKILEVAITSNDEFQQSLKQFAEAREAAFAKDDPSKMRAALEEVLQTVQGKLEYATHILHTFEQPTGRMAIN
jgi:methyl-accepting chemotaxis protein